MTCAECWTEDAKQGAWKYRPNGYPRYNFELLCDLCFEFSKVIALNMHISGHGEPSSTRETPTLQ